jgi:hypothetical protein
VVRCICGLQYRASRSRNARAGYYHQLAFAFWSQAGRYQLSWWIWVLVKYPALVLHYSGVLLLRFCVIIIYCAFN